MLVIKILINIVAIILSSVNVMPLSKSLFSLIIAYIFNTTIIVNNTMIVTIVDIIMILYFSFHDFCFIASRLIYAEKFGVFTAYSSLLRSVLVRIKSAVVLFVANGILYNDANRERADTSF